MSTQLVKRAGQGAAAAKEQERTQQYLTFLLDGEPFAIGILVIKEIIEYGTLTEVPLMPDFIRGVLNLRGAVVPVIDLAARFGRDPADIGRRSCIVIIEMENEGEVQDVGVVVDTVNEVLDIPVNAIQPAPSFGAKIRADFIDGMVEMDGRFIIILDVNRVLSIDEMALLAGIEENAAVDSEATEE